MLLNPEERFNPDRVLGMEPLTHFRFEAAVNQLMFLHRSDTAGREATRRTAQVAGEVILSDQLFPALDAVEAGRHAFLADQIRWIVTADDGQVLLKQINQFIPFH